MNLQPLLDSTGSLLVWLGRASGQASVLIVLVLLVQWLLRNRLTPRWRHALWLLVVVRLCLPCAPESRASLFNWIGGGSTFPKGREGQKIYWTEDQQTCVMPVQLESGKEYRLGLNSSSHKNFQSAGGVPLEPVVYTFKTGGK